MDSRFYDGERGRIGVKTLPIFHFFFTFSSNSTCHPHFLPIFHSKVVVHGQKSESDPDFFAMGEAIVDFVEPEATFSHADFGFNGASSPAKPFSKGRIFSFRRGLSFRLNGNFGDTHFFRFDDIISGKESSISGKLGRNMAESSFVGLDRVSKE